MIIQESSFFVEVGAMLPSWSNVAKSCIPNGASYTVHKITSLPLINPFLSVN
jgi:hypothetical protein